MSYAPFSTSATARKLKQPKAERGRRDLPYSWLSQHFSDGSGLRELLLVVLDHLLALGLRQVIRIADRVYSTAASTVKLICPGAGTTDRG